jgi:hypothetical protein
MPDPWPDLKPGERFRVRNLAGETHEAIFLSAGPGGAGLYVRLSSGEPSRLLPKKIEWTTLERLLIEDPLARDDEVMVTSTGGVAQRGRLIAPPDESLILRLSDGESVSLVLDRSVIESLRLVYSAPELLVGDEFLVTDHTGREYRARTLGFQTRPPGVVASLTPSGERVALLISELDLKTLRVLIPISLPPASS